MKLSVFFTAAAVSLVVVLSVDGHSYGKPVIPQRSSIDEQSLWHFAPRLDCHQCGKPNQDNSRIVGGNEVKTHRKYPWQVAVMEKGRYLDYLGGGSIISERWILTAAHCVCNENTCISKDKNKLSVWVGKHSFRPEDGGDRNTKLYDVEDVHIPRGYKCYAGAFNSDVALLKLTKAIPFNTVIKPICLPQKNWKINSNNPFGKVTGWGRSLDILKEADQIIWSDDGGDMWCGPYWGNVGHTQICAGYTKPDGACIGDSGGPLVVFENGRYVQVGVVSYGNGVCAENRPTVYARVTTALDWIATTTDGRFCG